MDPLRGNYQDDTESRRYRGGDHHYPEPENQTWFDQRGDDARMRGGGRPVYGSPPIGQPTSEQRPYPAMDPNPHWDPSVASAPPAPAPQQGRRGGGRTAVQSAGKAAGRGAGALILVIVVVIAAVPVFRLLAASAFGSTVSPGGIVSGVLMLLGLPLGALGLHGLTSDSVRYAERPASDRWFRPPVAYLTVALVLFVAAGLAA